MARSNYADKPIADDNVGVLPEHRLLFGGDHRAFTPAAGASDDPNAGYGKLAIDATGDWSWKPGRDSVATKENSFKTFRGVLAGAVELSARDRAAQGDPSVVRYSSIVIPVHRYAKLIAGVNGGWFDTLAGSHVGSHVPRRADIEVLGSDIDRSYSASDAYSAVCPA